MTEATGGRRYCNCQRAQEDVETLYNLPNNNNIVEVSLYVRCISDFC